MGQQLVDRNHCDIVIDCAGQVQAGAFAVLSNEGNAFPDDIMRRMHLDLFPLDEDLAAGQLVHAEDTFDQLAASCADQAANSQDFAPPDGKADVFDFVVRADNILCLKDHFADLGVELGEYIRDLTADHHFNQLRFAQVFRIARADVLSVTIYTDTVADRKDLIHAVRDVNNRDTLPGQPADMPEQQFDLAVGDCCGRLVHDDDLCVDRDRFDDFDQLALRNRQVPQRFLGGYMQAAFLNQPLRLFDLGFFVHQTVFAQFAADKNVFIHGHIQNRVQLLMDHGNAGIHGFFWGGRMIGLSVE